jgi:hypothetical protein
MEEMNPATITEIADFLANRTTKTIVVANVPPDIQQRLGTSATHVLLSRYTADKQKNHPEISAESFGFLQTLLDTGERVYDRPQHAVVILQRDKPYKAVLKVTNNGEEVYLQTFHRSDARNIAAIKKRKMGKG